VRDAAHRALRALSGKDIDVDADLWRAWWTAACEGWTPPEGDVDAARASVDPHATRATYHGLPVQSDALVFVIDASGSMNTPVSGKPGAATTTRWDAAGAELERTLRALPDGTRVNVLTFQGEVIAAFEAPQPLDERVRRTLSQILGRTSPRESGDLVLALESALAQPGADTVYLLTDGEPSAGRAVSPGRVQAAVRQANRCRAIAVHTIGFGAGKMSQRALLSGLARDSGGVCVFRED
jgi:Mg-chelatase subunit ChlD